MTPAEYPLTPSDPGNRPIGYVVGGGLKANLFVRLTVPAHEVQEGGFVVLESGKWQFYGLVTDLQLGALDPRYAEMQNAIRLAEPVSRLLAAQTLYTNLEVLPALMLAVAQTHIAMQRWPTTPPPTQPVPTRPT